MSYSNNKYIFLKLLRFELIMKFVKIKYNNYYIRIGILINFDNFWIYCYALIN